MPLLFNESWWSGINAVWGLLGILILVALGVLYMFTARRRETDTINEKRAVASDALVKIRDAQIIDLEKKVKELEGKRDKLDEELEDTTSEYRALAGIKVDELIQHWNAMRDDKVRWDNLEEENIILRRRLESRGDNNN